MHKTRMHKNKMYICGMYTKELLKGTLQTIILKLLEDNGRMYGYEITQKVKLLTDGKISITEGALYPILHKLEADGTVTTEEEYIGKRVRKYYTLTQSGKTVTESKVNELADFIKTIGVLLSPKPVV
ncbi:DNA-binding PadR family transcriptional regulator [Acetobacteroides hydrogenigenes]|uniref:DNA-binding PadR family transcriptional regulator n=2 Tax=Acetobacteroides hydrogenigenes TaxID=979970 RepID=A0A4R2F534_9BACT|nr:DNA-binding PadR family transcriptional regulator [Acetobacteroides hydrogenigenes]